MLKVLFMGRKIVARDCLRYLIEQPKVEVVGVLTDSHLEGSVTAEYARDLGLKCYTFEDACSAMELGELSFDLGISMLYWRKLKGQFLSKPKYGVINFHPAPLPEYKGVGGYNLAILEKLDRWGSSAHYVDEGIDTGPILRVSSFEIDPHTETAKSLEAKTQPDLKKLFEEVVSCVIENPAEQSTTPNLGGRYLSRADLEALKQIDPERDDIGRKIRAFWFPPYDGAWMELSGEKYTLVNRAILSELADPTVSSLFSPKTESKGK